MHSWEGISVEENLSKHGKYMYSVHECMEMYEYHSLNGKPVNVSELQYTETQKIMNHNTHFEF